MASVDTLRSDFRMFEADWVELRPYLLRYLPNDRQTDKADRLFNAAKRYLGRAIRADKKRQRPAASWWYTIVASWWYTLALARIREHNQLAEALGERGLQAQEEGKRRRKATA